MKVIFKSDCWNDAVERVERTLLTALCDSPMNLVSVEKCTGLITCHGAVQEDAAVSVSAGCTDGS